MTDIKTNSSIVEMSMRIVKASYRTSEENAMRWTAVDSDTDADLYDESMSVELYQDFTNRINNNIPVPDAFQEVICEQDWCGGVPYLSIAHYKAGTGKMNVPGEVESVFIDGSRLKSKGTLHDNDIGRAVWKSLREDLFLKKSDPNHLPTRISIGFLDLEHKHVQPLSEYTFTRTDIGQICPLCSQGIGGKIYMKGQLVHLALTRVPVNPRTEMVAEKSMGDEITTKRDDAKSIIGELAEGLEEKSIAADILVVKSDGTEPTPTPSELAPCYDPNMDTYNQECIDSVMDKYMPAIRDQIGCPVNSKSFVEVVTAYLYKSNGLEKPVEEAMETKVEEKSVAGVPVKPFSHTQDGVTVTGDGNPQIPNPVKADVKEDDEVVEEKSALDASFESLKGILASSKSVAEVQAAFNALGTEVEKSYVAPPPSAGDIAEIVRSAVEAAVTPLRMELATLKAQGGQVPVSGDVVRSKALNINHFTDPEQMIAKAITGQQPARKLTQIEELARRSTGVL
jgi:hypothetical protein